MMLDGMMFDGSGLQVCSVVYMVDVAPARILDE